LQPASVLVTGASGFLGVPLVRALLAAGCRVDAVSRLAQQDSAPNLRWWRSDLTVAGEIERVVAESSPEIVFHLAGLGSGKRELEHVLPNFHTHLESTVRLLAAATTSNRRRPCFGFARSAGPGLRRDPAHPTRSPGRDRIYARFFHSLYGTPVVSARIAVAYGPGQVDHGRVVPYAILSALRGEAPKLERASPTTGSMSTTSSPVSWRSPRFRDRGRVFDFGCGELVTVRQVVVVCHALDAPAPEFGAVATGCSTTRGVPTREERQSARLESAHRPEGVALTIVSLRGELAAALRQPL
jgi:nucleoside-diphosphate-sugar epimerase